MKGKKEIASPARLTIPSGISRNTSVHSIADRSRCCNHFLQPFPNHETQMGAGIRFQRYIKTSLSRML